MKPTELHLGASALHLLICIALLTAGPSLADRALNADIGAAAVVTALCAAALAGLRLQLSLALIAAARAFDLIGLPGAAALAAGARRVAPAALKASAASMTAVVLATSTAHAAPSQSAPAQSSSTAPQTVGAHSATPPPHWPTTPPGDTPYLDTRTDAPADPSWPTQPPESSSPGSQAPDSQAPETPTRSSQPKESPRETRDTAEAKTSHKACAPHRVTVAEGDSIWKIALAHPKPGQSTAERVNAISRANADVLNGNPDLIYPNTELELP